MPKAQRDTANSAQASDAAEAGATPTARKTAKNSAKTTSSRTTARTSATADVAPPARDVAHGDASGATSTTTDGAGMTTANALDARRAKAAPGVTRRPSNDAPTPTLRARLATLYANAALAASVASNTSAASHARTTPAQPALVAAIPTEDTIAATYMAAVDAPLSPAKRAMLAASLRGFDAQAAGQRMTLAQLADVARGVNPSGASATTGSGQDDSDDESRLTLAQLDAMTDETWRAFAQWLLERDGYTIERSAPSAAGAPIWRGERRGAGGATSGMNDGEDNEDDSATTIIVASAIRPPAGWPLEDEAVRRAASTAVSEAGAQAILITTAPATVGALLEARRLGVRLLDRAALGERLQGLATAYQREQAQAQRQNQARAAAASAARERLLAALSAVEVAFIGSGRLAAQAVSGRAAVKRAATEAREAQRLAAQALLAWETLLGEWTASFGERPARDGSLALLADPDAYDELATRGDHLRAALLTAIQKLVTTPLDGELGYGAWRQALGEDLLARIQTLRWRIQSLDPDHWHDYAAARDDDAQLEATAATNAATHAAARTQQAYAQLAARVGL